MVTMIFEKNEAKKAELKDVFHKESLPKYLGKMDKLGWLHLSHPDLGRPVPVLPASHPDGARGVPGPIPLPPHTAGEC